MKTMVTTLIALSVFGLVASAPARAFDAKAFYEQLETARALEPLRIETQIFR